MWWLHIVPRQYSRVAARSQPQRYQCHTQYDKEDDDNGDVRLGQQKQRDQQANDDE